REGETLSLYLVTKHCEFVDVEFEIKMQIVCNETCSAQASGMEEKFKDVQLNQVERKPAQSKVCRKKESRRFSKPQIAQESPRQREQPKEPFKSESTRNKRRNRVNFRQRKLEMEGRAKTAQDLALIQLVNKRRIPYHIRNDVSKALQKLVVEDMIEKAYHQLELKEEKNCLKRLAQLNLKAKPEKCSFLRKEINFYGLIFTANGTRSDPARIDNLVRVSAPKNASEPNTDIEGLSLLKPNNKLSPRFNPERFTIVERKGATAMARNGRRTITQL
ncbi:Hypothetical predicted protein, partial [Paramuricea clavata]